MMKAKGFTLIEVMVALAVFAIAMTALMSAMQNSAHNLEGLRNRTIAQWIASNRLVGYQSSGNYPKSGKTEKIEFGGVNKPREWVVTTEVIDMKTATGIMQLNVKVGEESDGKPNYYANMTAFINGK